MASSAQVANAIKSATSSAVFGGNQGLATVPPDLNAISDNSVLNVSADTGRLKLHQLTSLDKTFREIEMVEIYQQQNVANQTLIQGNFMYWTKADQIVLDIPVTVTFSNSTDLTNTTLNYGNMFGSAGDPLSEWIQPPWAMLRPLTRCEVALGENGIVMQKSLMNYANYGIFPNLDIQKLSEQEMLMLSLLGIPYSIGYCGTNPPTAGLGPLRFHENVGGYTPANKNYLPWGWADQYNQWKEACYNQTLKGTTTLTPTTALTVKPFNTHISVPLWMLNPFFYPGQYLPPNLKFRIIMEYTAGAVLAAFNNWTATPTTGASTGAVRMNVSWNTGSTGIALRYRGYRMAEELQRSVNLEWAQRNILYNYKTMEYVSFQGNGSTLYMTGNITLSQQRPEVLIFRIMNNSGGNIAFANDTANPNCEDQGTDWTFAPSTSFSIISLELQISGRGNIRLRMNETGEGLYDSVGLPSAKYVTTRIEDNIYQESTKPINPFKHNPFAKDFGQSFVVPINPGDYQQLNQTGADDGAMVIRFIAQICSTNGPAADTQTVPLPATHSLVVYKVYRQQILIDSTCNMTTVDWPVIVGGNNTVKDNYIIGNTTVMN